MVISKLDLLVVAVVAAGFLWVEHGHRVRLEAPPPAAAASGPPAAGCPANESVPFSADCMAFIQGRARQAESAVTTVREVEALEPACGFKDDNVPYSDSCLRSRVPLRR
jgi:hypothetical protein